MGMFGKVNLYRLNFSDLFSSETCLIAFARIFVGKSPRCSSPLGRAWY
jgi:hypothetical protein